jgi:hypothetical protein
MRAGPPKLPYSLPLPIPYTTTTTCTLTLHPLWILSAVRTFSATIEFDGNFLVDVFGEVKNVFLFWLLLLR